MFAAAQVEGKFFSLERQYKKTQLNNSLTGRNTLNCPYYSELNDLLRAKKGIHPEFVLDSETVVKPAEALQDLDDYMESPLSSQSGNEQRLHPIELQNLLE
ncbi:PREDICTED: uncharacterized protein LOC108369775, partial [Rhagoletis zephyria]|uniref:uncharacterized protein LOC108369775 n=1 Tax=Rhagoletis zephyria TaxID=28612 RepID=UPI0008119E31